jgi:hypothetical protein
VKSKLAKRLSFRKSISRPAPPTTETSTAEHPPSSNEQPRPIPDDEIAVDGYIMKPEVRGTSRDPRALKEEQWLVKVQMVHDGRTFNVSTEQILFDELKAGDRVYVSYRLGKYTKTVWGAQIKKAGSESKAVLTPSSRR